MIKDNPSPPPSSSNIKPPVPSRKTNARKPVRARAFPMPPTGLWLILGLLLVGWGFWNLRPERTRLAMEVLPPMMNSNQPAVAALASPTVTSAPPLSLDPIMTPVIRTNPPLPSRTDTEVVLPDGQAPGLTPVAAEGQAPDHYTVAAGDTLLAIATRFEISLEELMSLNGLSDPNTLQVGQIVLLPSVVELSVPFQRILPDSEVVLSPAYQNFDLQGLLIKHGGFLASYSESVEGAELNAAEIIERVSQRYSVGLRPLLAMLEYQSGWLTQAEPKELSYPMGAREPGRAGLFFQLSWAANRLNQGYYGKYTGRDLEVRFSDGTRAIYNPETNPGTAAIQNVFAVNQTVEAWGAALATDGFLATYISLFGDPWEKAIEPLLPSDLTQPELALPWVSGQTWYLTGGPHGGWGDRSGWASLDFAPPDITGCAPSSYWTTAAAPARVIRSENGEVVLDLDGDGFVGTGWTLLYMHIDHAGRIGLDREVKKGDPIGKPSCEGGYSTATHLHIARRYNGQWIEAGGPVPFTIGEWQTQNTTITYDGYLKRGEEKREACECRNDEINGLTAP